jgi:formylglycine-generating enzyme required for sulfatase activity
MTRPFEVSFVCAVAVTLGAFLGRGAVAADEAPVVAPDMSSHGLAHEPVDEPAPSAEPHPSAVPSSASFARPSVAAKDGMVRIPGGRYTMGIGDSRAPLNERAGKSSTVAPFWMDRTEVSAGSYRRCVDEGHCEAPQRTSTTCTYDLGDPELPVSCVRWDDADRYCRAAAKRLPREIEWEFAARGVTGLRYPWPGAAPDCSRAVTLQSEATGTSCTSVGHPTRVGSHPGGASLYGVQDLSGNVEEWTTDWYVERAGQGPAPRAGASHVLRGGGWLSLPSMSRTTSRNWGSAVEAGPNVGFRCARDE